MEVEDPDGANVSGVSRYLPPKTALVEPAGWRHDDLSSLQSGFQPRCGLWMRRLERKRRHTTGNQYDWRVACEPAGGGLDGRFVYTVEGRVLDHRLMFERALQQPEPELFLRQRRGVSLIFDNP